MDILNTLTWLEGASFQPAKVEGGPLIDFAEGGITAIIKPIQDREGNLLVELEDQLQRSPVLQIQYNSCVSMYKSRFHINCYKKKHGIQERSHS